MANISERYSRGGSPRGTGRSGGGKDHRRNPNFNIDRSNPAAAHTYKGSHQKPTIVQQFLGTGPGAADVKAVRNAYYRDEFKPKMHELLRGFRRPARVLKEELRDIRRGEGFDESLPSLAEDPKLRNRLSDRKKSIYAEVRRLERSADEDDPREMRKLERAHERADADYRNLVEHELRDLKLDYRHTERELLADRTKTMRGARKEIYDSQGDDETEAGGELA